MLRLEKLGLDMLGLECWARSRTQAGPESSPETTGPGFRVRSIRSPATSGKYLLLPVYPHER
ncbi:MAG: hypothetical protein QOD96_1405 [Pseudonocardiales bacterium]|nr:hypothetical protein [Pseudonocardiales bacterium]